MHRFATPRDHGLLRPASAPVSVSAILLVTSAATLALIGLAGCTNDASNALATNAETPLTTLADATGAVADAGADANRSIDSGTGAESDSAPAVDATSPESPRDRARREAWESAIRGVVLRDGRLVVTDRLPGGVDAASAARAERRSQELGNHRTAAVAAAVRVVRTMPDAARGWIELGESLGHRGRGELAAGAFTRALELASDPIDVFDARRLRATGHAAASDWSSAITDMEAALVVAPADGDAHARLAVWNWYAGDVAAASRHLERAEAFGGRVPGALGGLIRNAASAD